MTVSVENFFLVSCKERSEKVRKSLISHWHWWAWRVFSMYRSACSRQHFAKLLISKQLQQNHHWRSLIFRKSWAPDKSPTGFKEPWGLNHVWRSGCPSIWRASLQLVVHHGAHLCSRSGKEWDLVKHRLVSQQIQSVRGLTREEAQQTLLEHPLSAPALQARSADALCHFSQEVSLMYRRAWEFFNLLFFFNSL